MSTPQSRTISERSDDIPLLLHQLQQLQIAEVIDASLPPPHGNRQGLSYGQLSVLFLSYIMSQGDHRLCAVEDWSKEHRQTLMMGTGWSISAKDASDDRLGALVEVIGSQGEYREQIEQQLGQKMIRGYELPTEVARCDSSSFSVYHQLDEKGEEESLLRFGYSKDHRPDLRQYRQLLGTLDPAGIPLVSETLAGNGADDPIYLPTWERLVGVIGHKDFVYIADSKAGSHQTRAQLARAGGHYCFPLPQTGQTPALLKSWVLNPPTPWQTIRLPHSAEDEPSMGVGFEVELGKLQHGSEAVEAFHWSERYLVVRSDALAQRQQKSLYQRLEKAEHALAKLAAKPAKDHCGLKTQADAVLKLHRVGDYFVTQINPESVTRHPRPGRPSKKDTSEQIIESQFRLRFERQPDAIAQAEQLAGCRLYVTNLESSQLSLSQAMAYYREQWQLEHGFHRFKRGQLPALPIFLANEERIIGLMFLLTIALRCFTLIEFQVRRSLLHLHTPLAGLYAGNPKRKTERPSAELLLKAFTGMTLYYHRDGTTEITPLNPLQRHILALLKFPQNIYELSVQT